MRFFVRALRISTILAAAAISMTAAHAQIDNDDNDSSSPTSCAGVKPPAVNPRDEIDNIPLYIIPPSASGHRAACRATEALAEGMVDVELGEDRVLAEALSDPTPDTNSGEASKFPYSEPGSRPTPGFPPPGPSPETPDRFHAYAAFVDPSTGVEYTFSSAAENLADAEQAGADWIRSKVKPLLEHRAAAANAQVAENITFAAAASGTPSYNVNAWTLLIDATIAMPDGKLATGLVQEFGQKFVRDLGKSGATVRVFRLNSGVTENDYFLVDTAYTQTPSWAPFHFFSGPTRAEISTWANKRTQLTLEAANPNHSTGIQPTLSEFAPQTTITGSTETFTVGGNLTAAAGAGSGGGVSGSYSITRTQESVDTAADATLVEGKVQWTDTYNGFPVIDFFGHLQPPPPTSQKTFAGERLAIFRVPRTVNDGVPAGKRAGLDLTANLENNVQGDVSFAIFGTSHNTIYATWNINSKVFVPEPVFSASPLHVKVSRSMNTAQKPVEIKITAQSASNGAQKVPWRVTENTLNSVIASASVDRGSGVIKLYPKSAEATNEKSGQISVDSVPGAATDSLRNGPIQITVELVP
jgi:hypothetical protein